MFLLAKLHPHLSDTESENYNGPWLNRKGKEEIIERFYREKKRIPLCIDHRDTGDFGYVKPENTVGRVCDLFIDKDSNLILKCELSKKHQSGYKEVAGDIFTRQARWGVSVGTSKIVNPKTGTSSRHLAHVAFTKEPGFGDYDTYISDWGLEEAAINRVIAKKYPPKDSLLMHETLRNKLEGMSNIYFVPFFTPFCIMLTL